MKSFPGKKDDHTASHDEDNDDEKKSLDDKKNENSLEVVEVVENASYKSEN